MTISQYTLYSYSTSPLSQAIHLTLELSKLPYRTVQIDLKDKPEWFVKEVSSEGKVPVLKLGKHEDQQAICLPESKAIARYIADVSGKLIPQDPLERAQIEVFGLRYAEKVMKNTYVFFAGAGNEEKEKATQGFKEGLAHIEGLLQNQSSKGPYFLGEELSLADTMAAPHLAINLAIMGPIHKVEIQMDKYPRISTWIQAMRNVPGWSTAVTDDATTIKNITAIMQARREANQAPTKA
ncbi:glutathione S-transferase [Piptocephalis cylindrospora]|uniref:Glutathione S-transferase n=1 Tax=Piptocephalis cylindrospora TaxID=1907219 RepID=A0A4V1IYG6_9FUNG|nr:glutathione S-transferase [Piptocephalis cylindrospora]|eukprot:RKP14489.1 glutathione S-transferase [Piptocephalis cylindrospora]